jgi:hypothetical protein
MADRKKDEQLSHREELFVHAYVANGGNGADAARKAGYSDTNARARAQELLARPQVKKAIDGQRGEIVRDFKITAKRVLKEMAAIAFSRRSHYVTDNDGNFALAPGAPDAADVAVKRVKRKVRIIPQKASPQNPEGKSILEVDVEFELWNKDLQLRNLGEYLKLFKENRVDGDDDEDLGLTREEAEELALSLLVKAAKRRKALGGK